MANRKVVKKTKASTPARKSISAGRKQVENVLRKSKANLAEAQRMAQQLIEALPNPIFFKGIDGRYLGVNKAWEAYFATPRDAFVGKTVFDLYPGDPEIAQRLHADDQALWDHPGTRAYETTVTTPDGKKHDAIYYKATFTNSDGAVAGLVCTVIDITERTRADAAARESEERFRTTFEQAAVGIAHIALGTFRVLMANDKFCSLLGYTQDELIGTDSRTLSPAGEMPEREAERAQVVAGQIKTSSRERQLVRKDGSLLWVNRSLSIAHDLSGQPQYFISVIEDISERKRAELLLSLEHTVTRCLAEADSPSVTLKAVIRAICETQGWECGRYLQVDEQAGVLRFIDCWNMPGDVIEQFIASKREAVFGPGVGLAGRTWQLGQPTWVTDIKNEARSLRAAVTLETGMDCAFHFPVISEGKTIGVLAFNSREVREPDDRLLEAVHVIGSQIGQFLQRKQAEERIQYLATYDSLTSLPNRSMFHDRLTLAVARAKRSGQMAALMFLDLDRFKEINDTLGHAVGDKVLQATARLLRACLRDVDTVSRLGGDEFTVILEDITDAGQVKTVVERIVGAFSDPMITQEGRDIFVTASIGIALYPLDADNMDALLQAADAAMYRAKEEGRNSYEFHASGLNAAG